MRRPMVCVFRSPGRPLPPDAEVDGQASLWRFVQEERLDEGLRARLRRNGRRAGVVGGVPPREIARLLNPRPERARDEGEGSVALMAGATGVKQQGDDRPPRRAPPW